MHRRKSLREGEFLRRGDLNHLTGCGIASLPCCAFCHLEAAETTRRHFFTGRRSVGDSGKEFSAG
jgi:hypothetical protein